MSYTDPVIENDGTTRSYRIRPKDQDGTRLLAADIDSVTYSLTGPDGATVNDRKDVAATVDEEADADTGDNRSVVTITLDDTDNTMVGDADEEIRVLSVKVTYTSAISGAGSVLPDDAQYVLRRIQTGPAVSP